MKKFLPLLLAALLAFGLCGCAGSDAPDEPEATQVVEEPDYVPAFSDAESAAMASFMNKNRALIYESALYTFDFDGEYRPVLARYTPDGESVILADDCVPEFLLALDGRLYYVNTHRGGEIESIAPDGSDRQVLVDESCDWMQIYDGELYFCDGEAQFWHMQPDGSGKTLLLQGPCYYPYVFDGHVVYQDGRDECLYLAGTATGETLQLSYVPAYAPVILGGGAVYPRRGVADPLPGRGRETVCTAARGDKRRRGRMWVQRIQTRGIHQSGIPRRERVRGRGQDTQVHRVRRGWRGNGIHGRNGRRTGISMDENFIHFENVRKDYKAGEVTVTALHDVSFSIGRAEICVIVGESGAGKTTLLNILGGMDSLSEGRVTVDGVDISAFDKKQLTAYRRTDVGFVFQFYNLIPNLTALENVEIAAQLSKDSLDPATVLEQVGLGERGKNFPAQLSGGEQQRVAIARALAKNPKLLLCDEPTGALDYQTGKAILKLLQDTCRSSGMTVVIITHNKALCAMADRVVHIKSGTVQSVEKNERVVPVEDIEW